MPPGKHSYASYQLAPDTVYYLLPGTHVGTFQANRNDAFVGGRSAWYACRSVRRLLRVPLGHRLEHSSGNEPGVTIEYLTIEKFQPRADAAAINQSANTNWTLRDNTITLNAPGAGVIANANNVLEHNCMTLNGQYGFQSSDPSPWGQDALTAGPYNVTITDNEISYNDTCDFEGLISNRAIGGRSAIQCRHNTAIPIVAPSSGTATKAPSSSGKRMGYRSGTTISTTTGDPASGRTRTMRILPTAATQ